MYHARVCKSRRTKPPISGAVRDGGVKHAVEWVKGLLSLGAYGISREALAGAARKRSLRPRLVIRL